MALIAKDSIKEYQLADEGTHLATCNAVVGVGLQETSWGSQQDHVYLRWEIPAGRVRFTFTGDGGEVEEVDSPMTIWNRYNITLNSKANLRRDLDSWLSMRLTDSELQGFDMFSLIGKPCLLTVVHNRNGDRTYANVSAITRVMQGQKVPPMEMTPIRFGPDDTDQYDDLPLWLREKFDSRIVVEQGEPAVGGNDLENIDIPF